MPVSAIGQNRIDAVSDSLKKSLNASISPEQKVDTYNILSENAQWNNLDAAKTYANSALDLALENNYIKGKCLAYINLGFIELAERNQLKSAEYLSLVEILSNELSDEITIGNCYYFKAIFHFHLGNFTSAEEAAIISYKIFKKHNSTIELAMVNNFFGILYLKENKTDKAIEYMSNSLKLSLQQNDTISTGVIYLNLGRANYEDNRFKEAKANLNKALEINLKYNNLDMLANTYTYLGKIEQKNTRYKKAYEFYNRSRDILEKEENPSSLAGILNIIGKLYLIENKFIDAEKIIKKADSISLANDFFNQRLISLNLLSQIAEMQNDFANAFKITKAHNHLSDSLQQTKNQIKSNTLELLLDHEKEQSILEKEKQRLELKTQRNNVFIIALIGIVVFLVIIGIMLIRLYKQKSRNKELEMKELRYELEMNNRELTAYTFSMLNSNEKTNKLIEVIEKQLNYLPKKLTGDIASAITDIKNETTLDLWNEFEMRFTKVHSSFYDNLQKTTTDLSPTEIKVCTFLKLNMSTKEISSLVHRSPSTIEVYRTRIRKKLMLTNQNINLQSYLAEL